MRLTRSSAKELVVKGRPLIYFAGCIFCERSGASVLNKSGVIDRAI